MALTLSATLTTHLAGELLTLATLWKLTRIDGTSFHFTDHDKPITFDGDVYVAGIGYDRSAIEDKADLSSDNVDIKGILDTTEISREDIRAGLFDGASVWVRVVDYTDPSSAIIRRRGWLGEVRQNNLGQFDTELRGLSEAFSENLSKVYTPGCPIDVGSSGIGNCNRLMAPALIVDDNRYRLGDEVTLAEYPERVYRCTTAGNSAVAYDHYLFDVAIGATVTDGTVTWTAFGTWGNTGTVLVSPTPDRRTFTVNVTEERLVADPRWYDGGLLTWLTGDNAGTSQEMKFFDQSSGDDGEVTLYLRAPFDVNMGDTATLFPGCDKSISQCSSKFGNHLNFQGFPHIPGDMYLQNYPDAK